MGFGDVLDASFQIYRRAFWQLALIQAVVAIPVAIVQAHFIGSSVAGGASLSIAVVERNLPWSLLTGLLGLMQAAAVGALSEQATSGQRLRVGAAYGRIIQRLPWLLGFGIAAGLIVAVLGIAFVFPGVIALIYLAPGLFLATLGNEGVFRSIGHSFQLVSGYFWRVVGILLMAGVLVFIINLFVSLVTTVAANPLQNPHGATTAVITVTTIISIFLSSFPLVALYLQYVDLRGRKGQPASD